MLFLQQYGGNMKRYFEILNSCPLFAGISESDMGILLHCLSAKEQGFHKNEFIFSAGEAVTAVGVVLSGGVHVVQEDFWGNRTILEHMGGGSLFGEAFSCAEVKKLPISVIAAEKSDILLIDYRKIISNCPSSCDFHTGLIKNMVRILAEKNILLTKKIQHITNRTTREKILSYLSAQAIQAKSPSFTIPFDRQELADYLAVDRSAMSNELSKLRNNGILIFEKNRFELLHEKE